MIAETKLNETFPTAQFLIEVFKKPFRYDRNEHGGGLLIYVREGIPAKQKTEFKFPNDIECGMVEINLHNKRWLLFGIYRPPSQNEKYFLEQMGKAIDHHSNDFENIVILDDFNDEEKSPTVCNFLDVYNLKNLIKVPTCFKSDNPRSIDLILTNRNMCFKHTSTIETVLSDFHTMIVTVLKLVGQASKRATNDEGSRSLEIQL